jgi:hypothetical protein
MTDECGSKQLTTARLKVTLTIKSAKKEMTGQEA